MLIMCVSPSKGVGGIVGEDARGLGLEDEL